MNPKRIIDDDIGPDDDISLQVHQVNLKTIFIPPTMKSVPFVS